MEKGISGQTYLHPRSGPEVPELPIGSPVTVPRTYAQYVVTEYGVANLRYKSRTERAKELIAVAHPDLRGELYASLKKNFFPFASMASIK